MSSVPGEVIWLSAGDIVLLPLMCAFCQRATFSSTSRRAYWRIACRSRNFRHMPDPAPKNFLEFGNIAFMGSHVVLSGTLPKP